MADVPDRLLWCSWCFEKAYFNTVDRRWVSRDLIRCTKCWRYAAGCFKCSDGASRSSMNGENMDKLCAFCQGAVKKWGMPPDDDTVTAHGWCSHCLTRNSFRLITKNYIERNDYECNGCHRPACFCVKCSEAYTCGTAALCVQCEGSINDWNCYEELLLRGPAWCSWCIEFTAHRRQEFNAIRRNVYECTHCRQRTLPCTHCPDAMAEGGPAWDDDLCEKCSGRVYPDWPTARREKERVLTMPVSHERLDFDLRRDSPERQRATKDGLLRPFLLLVSMKPNLRVLCAAALGWNLILSPAFGDAHSEAGAILFESRVGVQARAMGMFEKLAAHTGDVKWEAILRRVQTAVWHTSPAKSGEAEAEEALLLEMARTSYQRLTAKERAALEAEMHTAKSEALLQEVTQNSALTRSELRAYALELCTTLVISPSTAVTATSVLAPALLPGVIGVTAVISIFAGPLFLIGLGSLVYGGAKLAWGSSEQRLLLPCILIVNQRILLGAQHFNFLQLVNATPLAPQVPAPTPASPPASPLPSSSASSASTLSSTAETPLLSDK